jgi:hypothetical protein
VSLVLIIEKILNPHQKKDEGSERSSRRPDPEQHMKGREETVMLGIWAVGKDFYNLAKARVSCPSRLRL